MIKINAMAKFNIVLAAILFGLVLTWNAAMPAPESENREIIHGMEVTDPYRWMEDFTSERVQAWSGDQSQATLDFVEGAQFEAMRERIGALYSYDVGFAGKMRGEKLFYMKRARSGGRASIHVRENGVDRAVISSADVPDEHIEQTFIGGRNFAARHWADDQGNMLAYWYNDGTSRDGYIRIIDTNSGLHLPEVLAEVGPGGIGLVWNAQGNGFYYNRSIGEAVEGGAGTRTRQIGLFYHRLGTQQGEDEAIIRQGEDNPYLYRAALSDRGQYLLVRRVAGLSAQNEYMVYEATQPQEAPTRLFADIEARFTFLGSRGNQLFFQTTWQAPNGQIVSVDINRPDEIRTLVAERDQPMLAGSNVGGDALGYFAGWFVIGYLQDGVPDMKVFRADGSYAYDLKLPDGNTVWGGLQGTQGGDRIAFSLLSAFSPSRIVSFDVGDRQLREEYAPDVDVDPGDFVVEHVFYTSKDGTRVPMYIARHKSTPVNGTAPTMIYGYGMHKWVSLLFYQAHMVHWMELGGIYAMPAIRGGGEYGDAWHEAGIKLNRQNAIDDFVWGAKWLIENGYSSADRMVANGSSASGPLAALAALRHRDVFAASTIDYPVADMVRAPLYGNGASMIQEYGSLEDSAEASAIISQSPYHEAQKSGCYAPSLIMMGTEDRVVLPFHGQKLAAAMQAGQSCDGRVMLYMMQETGHNYGGTAETFPHNTAVQLAFLRRLLGF